MRLNKTILIAAFCGLFSCQLFAQKQAHQQTNFCDALQIIWDHSLNNFDSLKGMGKIRWKGYYTDNYWAVTDSIPGFTSNTIHKNINGHFFYHATFYQGTDTVMGVQKYRELIQMMKKCDGKICCNFYDQEGLKESAMMRYEFWTKTMIKPGDKKLEKIYITLNFQINPTTKVGETFINVGYKE